MSRKNETPEQAAARQKLEEFTAEVGKFFGQTLKDAGMTNVGFTLLMFDFGESGALSYVSSARREDMIKTMKEFIEWHEQEEKIQDTGT